jgi:hypothetical protein
LRPVLEDPAREVWLELPSGAVEVVRLPTPEPDPQRAVLFDDDVRVAGGVSARVTVRRSARPIAPGMSRATRLGGLVVRSGRAAHESTFASHEGLPGTRHRYGEVHCEALEVLQREALDRPRPQVVVKVDRSGLNENHPVVKASRSTRALGSTCGRTRRPSRCVAAGRASARTCAAASAPSPVRA